MRPADQHLTAQETSRLLIGARQGDEALEQARAHAEKCEACEVLLERELSDLLRRRLGVSGDPASLRTSSCPEAAAWPGLLAGNAEGMEGFVEHAKRCVYCLGLLAMLDKAEEPEADEDLKLNSLASSTAEWRRSMASKMRGPSGRALRRNPWWFGAIAASVAALVLLGWWWRLNRVQTVYALLGEAYTARRSVELRIDGAEYAPLTVERSSVLREQPEPLLRAQLRIMEGLAKHPQSTEWEDAKARADLLVWNYANSIALLSRGLEAHLNNPALCNDLALAFFERAEAEDRAIDYGTAADYLGQALRARPSFAEARFNRAIVYERLLMYQQALEDWEAYLKLDSRSGWAAEAQRHLKLCREKLSHASSSNDFSLPEQALASAVAEWLPRASGNAKELWAHAKLLAQELSVQQGDTWLADAMSGHAPVEAFRDLSGAIAANAAGDPASAEQQARRAARSFTLAGNSAGALRAALEETYAMQRSGRGKACVETLLREFPKLGGRGYKWLGVQFDLERSICSAMIGDAETAVAAAEQAESLAKGTAYRILFLRTIGIRASILTSLGQYSEAWDLDRKGLGEYWRNSYPPMRAQQFFDDMMLGAESSGRWHVAAALAREAVRAATPYANHSFEAIDRAKLAEYSVRLGDVVEARQQMDRAESLFQALPQDRATDYYRLYTQIGIAQLTGGKAGLSRLELYDRLASEMSNEVVAARFLRARSRLLSSLGRDAEAEQFLIRLIRSGDEVRHSLMTARNRMNWQRELQLAYRELVRIRLMRNDAAGALRTWNKYLQGPCPGRSGSGDARPLAEGERVLTFVDLGEHFGWMTETPAGLKFGQIPLPAAALRELALEFAAACSDRKITVAEMRRSGERLYHALLAPFESVMDSAGTLIFEMDGALAQVPLPAIPVRGGYLGDQYRILSRPVMACTGAPEAGGAIRGKVLAVASPAVSETWRRLFAPLPDTRAEVESIASAYPATTQLVGSQASIEAVERGLAGAAVFHFAGHSLLRASGVSLMLSGADGVWQAARVDSKLLSSCLLAVFSACSTAAPDQTGEPERDDLVSAFLAAGVRRVVATRWDVDSGATASFMHEFYGALARGEAVVDAVRSAGRSLREAPSTAHPYYWAAFQAFGS